MSGFDEQPITPAIQILTRKIIPVIGEFKCSIQPYFKRNTNDIEEYALSLGGKDKCVNISIPADSNNRALKLAWADSTHECTLDSVKIKGNLTQTMLHLAITIAKESAPHVTHILLDDMSHFDCITPNGKKKTHLPSFYIAFYGKTWYEDKFGAVLNNSEIHTKYRKMIQNIYNPEYKPPNFNFINADLNTILTPLYLKTFSWAHFFNVIAETFGEKKCAMVYPWLKNAMKLIFENTKPWDLSEWRIDINQKNTPTIKYYEFSQESIQEGGMGIPIINPYIESDVNIIETTSWKYIKQKTRKNKSIRKGTRVHRHNQLL